MNRATADIREVAAAATAFAARIASVKRSAASRDFEWYPYDSFGLFPVLQGMLRDERRDLLALAGAAPVLDLGCGDGNLSFFFESLGCRVMAIDDAQPNFNGTRGFRALHAALGSSVEFQPRDLDSGLRLEGRTFGLALCLGVLYHLKNPYGLLETLARHARYCVMSTRIAQVTMRGAAITDEPVAYLVNPLETNNDASNYWIFSEAGLRRILERCGWDVCDYTAIGCSRGSDPASPDRDQRAFCMLRSKLADPWLDADLDGGWHAMEQGSWRWTERVFSVLLDAGAAVSRKQLRLKFRIPPEAFQAVGPVTLSAAVGDMRLPGCVYAAAGEHIYEQPVDGVAGPVRVRFELDKAFGPTGSDCRKLGVQVVFWSLDGPAPRPLRPIAFEP